MYPLVVSLLSVTALSTHSGQYIFVNLPGYIDTNWVDGNEYCMVTYGTSLATITSDAEYAAAEKCIVDSGQQWANIGLNNLNGSWQWASGEECDYDGITDCKDDPRAYINSAGVPMWTISWEPDNSCASMASPDINTDGVPNYFFADCDWLTRFLCDFIPTTASPTAPTISPTTSSPSTSSPTSPTSSPGNPPTPLPTSPTSPPTTSPTHPQCAAVIADDYFEIAELEYGLPRWPLDTCVLVENDPQISATFTCEEDGGVQSRVWRSPDCSGDRVSSLSVTWLDRLSANCGVTEVCSTATVKHSVYVIPTTPQWGGGSNCDETNAGIDSYVINACTPHQSGSSVMVECDENTGLTLNYFGESGCRGEPVNSSLIAENSPSKCVEIDCYPSAAYLYAPRVLGLFCQVMLFIHLAA